MNAVSIRIQRRLAVVAFAAALIGSLILVSPPASAATSVTFGPRVITGIPAQPGPEEPLMHRVVKLDTIFVELAAGKTAYVYSKLRAYESAHINLVDSEVICHGAGSSAVVLGENIDPWNGGAADRRDITIVNRFLVSTTSAGALTCDIYVRSNSLGPNVSSLTVSGELRFASFDVKEDVNGAAIQVYEPSPPSVTPVDPGEAERPSLIDRTLPAGYSSVAVAADTEFMSCVYRSPSRPEECPRSSDVSNARFTLFVQSMNGDTICASAVKTQVDVKVTRQTHHKVVSMYATVPVPPGCNRLYAYVKVEHLGEYVGGIQGMAKGLHNNDLDPDGPKHDAAMTHAFAVPS
jgi:hypothetical protein